MKDMQMKHWSSVVIILLVIFWTSSVNAVTPVNWKDTGFSINANGMKLSEVLHEFGQAYGVQVYSGIKGSVLLKGRLKADNGSEFLEHLMHVHDFRWFVYSGTLYVVPRGDHISARLEVGEDAVQDAKAALVGVGLFDTRFGWGELPDEGVVIVNGPQEYVNLVRAILLPEHKKPAFKGKQMMVFRLTYASASDRVITTRGQKETIPGIRSILNGLLNQGGPDKLSEVRGKFDVGSEKRSRSAKNGKGEARETEINTRPSAAAQSEESEYPEQARSSKPKSAAGEDKPRIDADTSINAIIVYDYANKREMYKTLIAELDVEPQQIEIEALIVDIDRNKLSEMGVEWSVTSGNTVTTVNSGRNETSNLQIPVPGAALMISNLAHFYAKLKAMESTGEARVLAKPTVLTLDNVAAVLDLSQTTYVPLVGERVAELASVTAGTMLRVVPRVLRDANRTRVRLEVDIEDGALGDPAAKSNVTRSTISTQAIVEIQQTLMIGGYHSESTSKGVQKIPLLGDVPLLGQLFRTNSDSRSERERLFLITPRLSGTSGAAAMEQSRNARSAQQAARADQSAQESRNLNQDKESLSKNTKQDALAVTAASPDASANAVESVATNVVQKQLLAQAPVAQAGDAARQNFSRKRNCAKEKNWLTFAPTGSLFPL